jgi:hypothetical protein
MTNRLVQNALMPGLESLENLIDHFHLVMAIDVSRLLDK